MRGAVPCRAAVQRRIQLRDRNRIQLVPGRLNCLRSALPEGRLEETVRDFKAAPVALSEAVLTQGRDLFAVAMKLGQEGIMAKLLDGRYAPGRRTGLWKKIKPRRPDSAR